MLLGPQHIENAGQVCEGLSKLCFFLSYGLTDMLVGSALAVNRQRLHLGSSSPVNNHEHFDKESAQYAHRLLPSGDTS